MKIELENNKIKIDNRFYPMVGFGTYQLQDEVCEKSVQAAFDIGYRCFDTATMYQNFEALGKGLKNINRDEIIITSKVWPSNQSGKELSADLETTLQKLNMDYLDIYLLHWPDSRLNLKEIIGNFNKLIDKKLVRFVGLSNITVHHLKTALDQKMPVSVV